MECSKTNEFLRLIHLFISNNIDRKYVDLFKYYFITCTHDNVQINFINATAKWYISNRFQNKQSLIWDGFVKQIKLFLLGEKRAIAQNMRDLFP